MKRKKVRVKFLGWRKLPKETFEDGRYGEEISKVFSPNKRYPMYRLIRSEDSGGSSLPNQE